MTMWRASWRSSLRTRRAGRTSRPCSARAGRGDVLVSAVQAGAEGGVQVVPRGGARHRLRPDRVRAPEVDDDERPRCVPRRRARRLVRGRAARQLLGLLRVYRVPWEGRARTRPTAACGPLRASSFARVPSSWHHLCARQAAVNFARERGARALEGYPMIAEPGNEIIWTRSTSALEAPSRAQGSPRSAVRPSAGS